MFILITIIFCFILYVGPGLYNLLTRRDPVDEDLAEKNLEKHLIRLQLEASEFNAHIQYTPSKTGEKSYLSFIGNGLFGIVTEASSPLYIKSLRTLNIPVFWHPVVTVKYDEFPHKSVTAIHYLNGIVFKYECYKNGLCVTYQHYAHRTLPNILVQEIEVSNPTSENIKFELTQLKQSNWPTATSHILRFQPHEVANRNGVDYEVISGIVTDASVQAGDILAVSVVTKKLSSWVEVAEKSKVFVQVLTSICYSQMSSHDYSNKKDDIESDCVQAMKEALRKHPSELKQQHINVWQQLWSTGIYISFSKAADALNGDQINATMYYVLSNVRSPIHEEATTVAQRSELTSSLSYPEGCYGGYHHTFQAVNLWGDMYTLEDVSTIVSYWLLTLEKQGCPKLVGAGASGVMQAMVLSFGSFRFRRQHLEFNIHPKFLHRDYTFRRINYGNLTHVNISVVVQDDNKAVLNVALDRSDKNYYACDGGCLDDPVQLGPEKVYFPVKLTDPVTAILYITSDKQHMELLRHTLHVKEVNEAPAHEHHVIALHKHGHHLGGLPTLFWVSVCFLIIVFHLFLFKLIYNEYCGVVQDKYRMRHGKM